MTKSAERNLVIGLDVGTSKVVATVGEITTDNKLSIVGVGSQVSHGMDKGGVNDLNLVSESIRRAIDEAELMADCRISSVYLVFLASIFSVRTKAVLSLLITLK